MFVNAPRLCALALPSLNDALPWPSFNFIDHGGAEAHRAIFDDYGRLCAVRAKGDACFEVPSHQNFPRLPGPLRADDGRHAISGAGVARTNDERVVAAAATEGVYAVSAIYDVIAQAAIYDVIAVATNDDIIACFSVDCVVAAAAHDPIMACSGNAATAVIAKDDIISSSAHDAIVAATGLRAGVRAVCEVSIAIAADHDAVHVQINRLTQIASKSSLGVASIAVASRQGTRERQRDCSVCGHPYRACSLVLGDGVTAAPVADCGVSIGCRC